MTSRWPTRLNDNADNDIEWNVVEQNIESSKTRTVGDLPQSTIARSTALDKIVGVVMLVALHGIT